MCIYISLTEPILKVNNTCRHKFTIFLFFRKIQLIISRHYKNLQKVLIDLYKWHRDSSNSAVLTKNYERMSTVSAVIS